MPIRHISTSQPGKDAVLQVHLGFWQSVEYTLIYNICYISLHEEKLCMGERETTEDIDLADNGP